MKKYHLYVKKHNKTGLKYLGFTTQDPFGYRGSGKYWNWHILIHGEDITTEILGTYNTIEDLREAGLYYSKLWNVVESDEWANLTEENGMGGATFTGRTHTETTKLLISQKNTGRYPTNEHREKLKKARQGRTPTKGVKFSKESRYKMSQARKRFISRSKSLPSSASQSLS